MDMKSYILVGGGGLICLVLLHALVSAWRASRQVPNADSAAAGPDPLDVEDEEALWTDAEAELTGEARVEVLAEEAVADELPGPAVTSDETTDAWATADAGIGEESETEAGVTESWMADTSLENEETDAQLPSTDGPEPVRQGRRIDIPGKRTEPTVPRANRAEFHTFTPALPGSPRSDANGAGSIDDVIIVWVVAKPGRQLDGEKLFKGFMTHGLTCGLDRVFKKADARCGGDWYTVANGVEPGTFDVSEPGALTTPGIVMLMNLVEVRDPGPAFEDMLDVAQDLAISLDAELKDERRSDMSAQTIEHCRQRIRDHRRLLLRA